jgi:protein arginine N-methyltransferase 5
MYCWCCQDSYARDFTTHRCVRPALILPWQPQREFLQAEHYLGMQADPVKYELYYQALVQWVRRRTPKQWAAGVSVVVVGAGFGGILRQCIRALQGRSNCTLDVVERNPLAITELRRAFADCMVPLQIQEGDCRTFDVNLLLGAQKFHHIDLFVSELLGGFGDNELWPECLQPFEAHCRTLNGAGPPPTAIPASTRTFVAPVQAELMPVPAHFQQLWVVDVHLPTPCEPPQRVYELVHPLSPDLNRQRQLHFKGTQLCSGLLGYFTAHLNTKQTFSNLHDYETPDLLEWAPVYFPFQRPVQGPFTVTFRRCSSARQAWYEWDVQSTHGLECNNTGGRHCAMQLS